MTVRKTIFAVPPREIGGPTAVNRFAFQANWSILHLLELRKAGQSFVLLFEYHDDLAVVKTGQATERVSFFQLKGHSNGKYNCTGLTTKVGKVPPRTIVSRLYEHLANFGSDVDEASFVTTRPFELKLGSGQKSSDADFDLQIAQLHTDEVDKLQKAISDDFPNATAVWAGIIRFRRTALALHDQQAHVIGRIAQHLYDLGHPEAPVQAIYSLLFSMINARSGVIENVKSFDDLAERKGLSSSQVEAIFNRALSSENVFLANWPTIANALEGAGYPLLQIMRIQTLCLEYRRKRNGGDAVATRFEEGANALIGTMGPLDQFLSPIDLASAISSGVAADDKAHFNSFELLAASLVEAHDAVGA